MLPQNNNPRTIYINPNFKGRLQQPDLQYVVPSSVNAPQAQHIPASAHINPLFLERAQRPTIHMNPRFLMKLQDQNSMIADASMSSAKVLAYPVTSASATLLPTYPVADTTSSCVISNRGLTEGGKTNSLSTNSDKAISAARVPASTAVIPKTAPTEVRKIICKSKNRLIREPLTAPQKLLQIKAIPIVPPQPIVHVTKRKLIRKSAIQQTKITKQTVVKPDPSAIRGSSIKTKYKLDNRVVKRKLPPAAFASVFKIKRKSFVGRFALRRTSTSSAQSTNTWKKFGTTTAKSSTTPSVNKKLQLLNINGLLYKSTRNSLKLKDLTNNSSNLENKSKKPTTTASDTKPSQGLTIFVRGTKYIMDPQKYKLTRVTAATDGKEDGAMSRNKAGPTCRRIDIGGFTYISTPSKNNVLIRTRNHLARAYVNNAKQKSLQILSKHLIKSNVPCPIYQRVGKCAAHERGKCLKVHNKQQVAICSKFLRGECLNSKCLLSHEVSLSKMPVCKFYMQGVCVRNDCPYLHKKLSDNAEVCIDFLRGYCKLADKCNKRHEFVCPEHERTGVCTIKNCVYCKSKQKREKYLQKQAEISSTKSSRNVTQEKIPPPSTVSDEQQEKVLGVSGVRYFIGTSREGEANECKEKEEKEVISDQPVAPEETDKTPEDTPKKRPKLGALPAYIPL
ncbi:zinc finger CCCH domain-containing protein 3 [Musca domestica]|uniref:Zinc finger CCCH domain-containing protein 3 n=1 Tax=Musca domestica TaxID=7370 RepID=A0A9J7CWY2_MUSDO|nr:zinc finger CCCH domain-containing protein 3 [Musca domestica]